MFRETNLRSAAKAFSWRMLGTIATTVIVFVFTGRFTVALAVGGLEFVSKLGLYWFHERVWDRIRLGKRAAEPAVLWFTGLSGAGKSTIARRVWEELRGRGLKAELLDGDTVRDIFPNTGFTRPERDAHVRRVGYLASRLEENGVFVVASFISPYEDSRRFVRQLCKNFVEVHVATPLEECERRDVKGLYARARRGEIAHFTGVDDPYEEPTDPELRLDTRTTTPEAAAQEVLGLLRNHW